MNRPRLVIAAGRDKAILRHHPWIFSGAVKRVEGNPAEGDLVDVCSASGEWLAMGHFQNDNIVCKVLTFNKEESLLPIAELLRRRVVSAIGYRRQLGFFDMASTNVFRLIHAEGDYLPGLVADWYDGVVVLQAHSVGMHRCFPQLVEIFMTAIPVIMAVYDKSSATCPGGATDGFVFGPEVAEKEVVEYGNRLIINFYEGQKTGFFVDQRENRRLVADLSRGRSVLNCFGYTGGFSLAALRGGASYVETVDISKKAIALCDRNVALNFGPEAPHRGVVADVLQRLDAADKRFDFIVLDPPAFAKNHRALQAGLKGYRSINQRAMEALPDGGLLMTFSCSQAVSRDDFQTMLFTAAMNAGRRVRIVRQLPHAADHPVSIHHPEGEYLKGLLLEVE
ncbi:MAG: class I SAM-dependent rRNA methyltransferase [Bacteroidales bacterium]|nr:class I SAM-dependent rRNA methyltransferase [Bacteroidales bacterium]